MDLSKETKTDLASVLIGNYRIYSGERGGGGYPSIFIGKKVEGECEGTFKNVCAIHPSAEELEALIVHLKTRLAYTLVNKVNQL